MKQPKDIIAIYDNGGKTLDRYSFYTDYDQHDNMELWECLATDATGQGFSQFSYGKLGRHNGKKINWDDLTPELQQHVTERLTQ